MAGITDTYENQILDAIFNNSALTGFTTVYVKLHTGDPGETASSNAATETTRAAVTFGAASGGTVTSDSAATWTAVSTTETYTHISLWSAATDGTAIWKGALTSSVSATAGNNATIASGSLTVSVA